LSRILALIDLALDQKRKAAFGGLARVSASAGFETLFSTLQAPLQMLWQLQFVFTIFLGINVGWEPQKRTADGTSWSFALRHHWGHTVIGLIWGAAVLWLAPLTFWWFAPVLAGMLLAIPLSVWTSRSAWGTCTRNLGLFLTPEETTHSAELGTLRMRLAALTDTESLKPDTGELAEVVLDPYVNAIHVSLLRENALNPDYTKALVKLGVGASTVRLLGEKLLTQGIESLKPAERILLLSDADVMSWLHRQVWLRAKHAVAPSWRIAIRRYAN
jgi:membrane glycosyltransferase